jgi:AbrB family looped-hinge helix DNA binding protein
MHVSIDRAGRVVVPKHMRDALGLSPGTALEVEVVDGHLELSASYPPHEVVSGRHGPSIAATGTAITDEDVRRALEAARARE